MTPLVSAIVSTYKSEKFIRGKLEDLQKQTLGDRLEIVIINSGSPQDEDTIIREFMKDDPRIRYIKTEERETIYKAWNRGIASATGKYITNSNTDDRLHPDALRILADTLEQHPEAGMVYADQYITPEENIHFESVMARETFFRRDYSRIGLFTGYLPGPQSMWRASFHHEHQLWFDDKYEVAGDYDFAMKVAEISSMIRIDGVLGSYFRSPEDANKEYQNRELTANETYAIKEKYVRRFLQSLSTAELETLKKEWMFFMKLPHILYVGFFRLMARIHPRTLYPSRLFYAWLLSLYFEEQGAFDQAAEICTRYKNRDKEGLLLRQLARLQTRSQESSVI